MSYRDKTRVEHGRVVYTLYTGGIYLHRKCNVLWPGDKNMICDRKSTIIYKGLLQFTYGILMS